MTETEADELYHERAEHHRNRDAIHQRNLSDVVAWRYANLMLDPLSPEGPLAKIDFDLYMCDGFTRPTLQLSNEPTKKCFRKFGYDASNRLRYEEQGTPLAWEYQDGVITEFNLSGPLSRARIKRAAFGPAGMDRVVEVFDDSIHVRTFEYDGARIARVHQQYWKKNGERFALDTSFEIVHYVSYDDAGELQQVESASIRDGQEGPRSVSHRKRTVRNWLFGKDK